MNREEIIEGLKSIEDFADKQPSLFEDGAWDALFEAIELLRMDSGEYNNPLTLEQIRQMDGQPVYVKSTKNGSGRWGIIDIGFGVTESLWERDKFGAIVIPATGANSTSLIVLFELIGKEFDVYPRNPEKINFRYINLCIIVRDRGTDARSASRVEKSVKENICRKPS